VITCSNNNNNNDNNNNNNNKYYYNITGIFSQSSFKNTNNNNKDNNNNNNNNYINIRGKVYLCLLISKTPGGRVSKCMQCRTVCILNPAIRPKRVVNFLRRSKKPQGHCAHTSESTNIKVQNIFHLQSNITCGTNCKYRTAATPCFLVTWFVSSTRI